MFLFQVILFVYPSSHIWILNIELLDYYFLFLFYKIISTECLMSLPKLTRIFFRSFLWDRIFLYILSFSIWFVWELAFMIFVIFLLGYLIRMIELAKSGGPYPGLPMFNFFGVLFFTDFFFILLYLNFRNWACYLF